MRELDEAVRARAAISASWPVYVEIPTDVLRAEVLPVLVLEEWLQARRRASWPCISGGGRKVDALWSAERLLVITGRGARGAGAELVRPPMPPARSTSTPRRAAARAA